MTPRIWWPTIGLALGACSGEKLPSEGTRTNLQVSVTPLTLPGIVDADYRITIWNQASPREEVTTVTISSRDYGDGRGAATYIAPCDASTDHNTVELELLALYTTPGTPLDPDEYVNPAPAGDPIAISAECVENADTLVTINLAIMRDANQGFFDIAVNFDDVFCSAKLDCAYADGPMHLLHDEDGQRGPTMVLALACTSGTGETGSFLYLSPITITCGEDRWTLEPSGEPGQQGARPELIYQWAIYRGTEALGGDEFDKCYTDIAIGIDVAHLATYEEGCVIEATGTAAASYWSTGRVPGDSVYPIVRYSLPFSADGTEIACDPPRNAMDVAGSKVETGYVRPGEDSPTFTYALDCDDGSTTIPGSRLCQGQVPTVAGQVLFRDLGDGTVVASVGDVSSPVYRMPATVGDSQVRLGDECCVDFCCAE